MDSNPLSLSFALTSQRELVVIYPDGTRDFTGIYPSYEDFESIQSAFNTTWFQSLIMRARAREIHDGLTGLLMQMPARSIIQRKFESLRAKQFEGMCSLLLIDLDNFGQVNKVHGQNAGDSILRWVTAIILRSVREHDVAARWGGDEFLVFAPAKAPNTYGARSDDVTLNHRITTGTTIQNLESILAHGRGIADRIRKTAEINLCNIGGTQIAQTVTIGVASVYLSHDSEPEGLLDRLLDSASAELYKAKRKETRNTTCVADLIKV